MKKIILSVAALFAFGFANAQDAKETTGGKGFANSDVFVTGSVGFSSTKTGDIKSNSFNVNPAVGFFVTDNIAIGGIIGYTSTTQDQFFADFGGYEEVKTTAFNVGAFARYYATPASDFSFFGQLEADYVTSKSELTDFDGSDIKSNGFAVELAPGVSYFISSNFALEAQMGSLSYMTIKPDYDGAESTNTFDLNVNLTDIKLGLVYKF